MDDPGARKVHVEPVPYLGGVGLLIALGAVLIPSHAVGGALVIVGLSIIFGTMGFLDDFKRGGLSAKTRLLIQAVGASLLFLVGVQISLFDVVALDFLLTLIWVVGITNAFNLLDNMDGLCAGIATVAAFFFAILAFMEGQWLVGALSGTVFGFTLGFLIFNFAPARIFLGDMGSLTLGFILAAIGIQLRFPEVAPSIAFAIPILVLGVAVFDTALVAVLRLRDGVPVTQGGKDHTSHRLVNLGMPHRVAVGLLWIVTAALGAIALVVANLQITEAAIVVTSIGFFALVAGVVLSFVPVVRVKPDVEHDYGSEGAVATEEGTVKSPPHPKKD